jgi:DNA polymerase/3'-5' exonuclease PolX
MTRKSKGYRPAFFETPAIDQLVAISTALAAEVSVLRDRLDTLERLADQEGLISREEIESYVPDEQVAAERDAWRMAYLRRVMRVVHDAATSIARDETQEAYEELVHAVSTR